MPELPEVEHVVRTLRPQVLGATVAAFTLGLPKLLRTGIAEALEVEIGGLTVTAVERRAKAALIQFSDGHTLAVRLGMTGTLSVTGSHEQILRHTHWRMAFSDGRELRFVDPRQFGQLHWLATSQRRAFLDGFGPEPLRPQFTAAVLAARLTGSRGQPRHAPIKALLLGQEVVAGVGNIYADEALFRAGIDPRRPAGTLSLDELGRLHRGLRAALRQGVALRGSTIRDYRDAWGAKGEAQEKLRVYGRGGLPCLRCRRPLQKTVVAGRGTCFCPHCQS